MIKTPNSQLWDETSQGTMVGAIITAGGSPISVNEQADEFLKIDRERSSVSYDRSGQSRSSIDIELITNSGAMIAKLNPSNTVEIHARMGVSHGGIFDWVSLGIFFMRSRSIVRDGSLYRVSMSGTDRSERIRANRWKNAYSISSGTNYATAITNTVANRALGFTAFPYMDSTSEVTPAMLFTPDDDPWDSILKMGEGIGWEVFFDRFGNIVGKAISSTFGIAPVRNFSTSGFFMEAAKHEVLRDELYSGVVCYGSAPWLLLPVKGEVWDDNPGSRTYRLGPFGEKPFVMKDPIVTTNTQAVTAATAKWERIRGVQEQMTFDSVIDPRVEVSDIVMVSESLQEVKGVYQVETLKIPFEGQRMSGTIRRRVQ